MLLRNLGVSIDESTWPAGATAPARFKPWIGAQAFDVDTALLFVALYTRPPVVQGFSLADTWAWLRYRPAIAGTPGLRLRREWTTIGRHQKTVLSDELGVGFATSFLAQRLGVLVFADTDYVINSLLPKSSWLRQAARTGPRKSPDYLGFDSNLELTVLECKGSQNKPAKLMKAMQDGVAQKRNFASTWPIPLSVVAGLFIPQWGNSESAILHFIDPVRHQMNSLLQQQPIELVRAAALQIAYAKVFALIGRPALAQECALTPIRQFRRVHSPAALREREITSATSIRAEHAGSVALDPDVAEPRLARVSAVFELSQIAVDRWYNNGHIAEMLIGEVEGLRSSFWFFSHSNADSMVKSPIGLSLTLEIIEVG